MPKKHYEWNYSDPPKIEEHSRAKHRILRAYIERYIQILMANPRRESLRLTIVDGFAGGGIYQLETGEPHLGSPLILMEAVENARRTVGQERRKPLDINADFVLVEKEPHVINCLRTVVANHRPPTIDPSLINTVSGEFEANLHSILAAIESRGRNPRAIFVLDQYGYSDVVIPTLRRIFERLPNAEIFMTLAVGWITAYLQNEDDPRDILSRSMQVVDLDEVEEVLLRSDETTDAKRRWIQVALHETFARRLGARFYTPFFIHSATSSRPYWFLHLANNPRANDEVKTLHWEMENHFVHYGRSGTMMLGFDPRRDWEREQTRFDFDRRAKELSHGSLLDELPRLIADQHPDGVEVRELFSTLSNETPANEDMLKRALTELCVEGELAKMGASGQQRRLSTGVKSSDIILWPRQLHIPFGSTRGRKD